MSIRSCLWLKKSCIKDSPSFRLRVAENVSISAKVVSGQGFVLIVSSLTFKGNKRSSGPGGVWQKGSYRFDGQKSRWPFRCHKQQKVSAPLASLADCRSHPTPSTLNTFSHAVMAQVQRWEKAPQQGCLIFNDMHFESGDGAVPTSTSAFCAEATGRDEWATGSCCFFLSLVEHLNALGVSLIGHGSEKTGLPSLPNTLRFDAESTSQGRSNTSDFIVIFLDS